MALLSDDILAALIGCWSAYWSVVGYERGEELRSGSRGGGGKGEVLLRGREIRRDTGGGDVSLFRKKYCLGNNAKK